MRNNSTWAPSPLSPTNWPREAWHPLLTLLTLVGTAGAAFVTVAVYFIVAASINPEIARTFTSPDQMVILQFVVYLPVVAFLLLVLPPLSKTSLAGLGFRAPTARDLWFAVAGAVAMAIIVDLSATLIALATHRQDTEQAVALLKSMKTPLEQIAFIAMACVVAPMCEELFFRVLVYNALTRYFGIPAAIVVSGMFFGLLHASKPGEILTVGVPLALGGMTLAYVYAQTRCFWANVTTHALFNSISVVAFFFFHVN